MEINNIKYFKVNPEKGLIIQAKKLKNIEIVGLTDIHFGAIGHHIKKFKKALEYILKEKNRFVFLNGDNLDYVPPSYKFTQEDQNLKPMEQLKGLIEILKPLKNRLLWIKGGNHDTDRSMKVSQIDIIEILARELNVPYYPSVGFIKIVTKERVTKIIAAHGNRVNKNPDLELDAMRNIYAGADIYYCGHDHSLYVKPVEFLMFNGKEHLSRQWYIRGGSFLKFGSYARLKNLSLRRIGFTSIIIKGNQLECKIH